MVIDIVYSLLGSFVPHGNVSDSILVQLSFMRLKCAYDIILNTCVSLFPSAQLKNFGNPVLYGSISILTKTLTSLFM